MDNPTTSQDRNDFGRNVAILMALKKDDKASQSATAAFPSDVAHIRKRLRSLSQDITSSHADLLELLVRFDELEGWRCNGSKHCAAWMNTEIGISVQSGWEYLRVGRKLRTLTTLRALFRVGKVSWSKVRLITRVADKTNESLLCHAALDASVSDVKLLCKGYRWNDTESSDTEAENNQAMHQWQARSLTWANTSNGNTRIQITLPPELAEAFLNSVEQSVNQTDTTSTHVSQRRADAAVLMAEKSLQSEGREIATADRYQVVVSVDAAELPTQPASSKSPLEENPRKRPTIQNTGPITKETARRIACDCSISVNHTEQGEPTSIGRKSRVWPTAMARAIKDRDQVCVWPGCIQSRHLHIHHIKHWADGGETSVNNGACLCSHHHTLVHEGGYTLINAMQDEQSLDVHFFQQLKTSDVAQFSCEKELRYDWESFDKVRKLMPSRYRFRIIDADGKDITEHEYGGLTDSTRVECREVFGEYKVRLSSILV